MGGSYKSKKKSMSWNAASTVSRSAPGLSRYGLSASTDLVYFVTMCTGELPVEMIRLKAKGVIPHGDEYGIGCGLAANKGFTLPSNIGELGDDITELNLISCSLIGSLSTRYERPIRVYHINILFWSGPLPKQLPVSLEVLDLSGGPDRTGFGGQHGIHKSTGGIPSEWAALTNLKTLKMQDSGLDGKRSAPMLRE